MARFWFSSRGTCLVSIETVPFIWFLRLSSSSAIHRTHRTHRTPDRAPDTGPDGTGHRTGSDRTGPPINLNQQNQSCDLPIDLSIDLAIYLSIYLSIHPSIYRNETISRLDSRMTHAFTHKSRNGVKRTTVAASRLTSTISRGPRYEEDDVDEEDDDELSIGVAGK